MADSLPTVQDRLSRLLRQTEAGRPLYGVACPQELGPFHARLIQQSFQSSPVEQSSGGSSGSSSSSSSPDRPLYVAVPCVTGNSSSSSASDSGSGSSSSGPQLHRMARLLKQSEAGRPLYAAEEPCCLEGLGSSVSASSQSEAQSSGSSSSASESSASSSASSSSSSASSSASSSGSSPSSSGSPSSGSESASSGSASSSTNDTPLPVGCCDCPVMARRYKLKVAGVGASDCLQCTAYNNTADPNDYYILTFQGTDGGGRCIWTTDAKAVCGGTIGPWIFQTDLGSGLAFLNPVAVGASLGVDYRDYCVNIDCLGSITLDLNVIDVANMQCDLTTWPATLTLIPL